MSILEIKNFSKTYGGEKKAADNVNLTIEAGDIYGFIGHNGAGKSTTIRAAVGVLEFDEGDIFIDGHSVKPSQWNVRKSRLTFPITRICTSI